MKVCTTGGAIYWANVQLIQYSDLQYSNTVCRLNSADDQDVPQPNQRGEFVQKADCRRKQ